MAVGKFDKIMDLCLRRGFFWPSAEIYGGFAGFYDYGHLGAMMKRKWELSWHDFFLRLEPNYYLIDSTNIIPYKALESSGHVKMFTDYMVSCVNCKVPLEADVLVEEKTGESAEHLNAKQLAEQILKLKIVCPKCKGQLGGVKEFNTMFPISLGVTGKDKAFLRPETAQGAYLNFKREFTVLRKKLPLGLGIIGRVFRNEISPRQALYRVREPIQAELQIFHDPNKFDKQVDFDSIKNYKVRILFAKDRKNNKVSSVSAKSLVSKKICPKFYAYHLTKMQKFYLDILNVPEKKFRFYEKVKDEMGHYNKIQFDLELDVESWGGFREISALHLRGDYDLTKHQKGSGEKMEVTTEDGKVLPHVLELTFGVDRNIWALLDIFYEEDKRGKVLRLPAIISPYTAAVFPLVNKNKLPQLAKKVHMELLKKFDIFYDESGSIGKRYRRHDEIGTPYCLTIDHDSLKKQDVTIRDRDSMKQKRIKISKLIEFLRRK